MARLLLLIVFATLALLTFAAPAPAPAKSLTKRSFKAKTKGRTLLSPGEEVARTQRKYSRFWEIIVVGSGNDADPALSAYSTYAPTSVSSITAYPTPYGTAAPSGQPQSPPTYGNRTKTTSSTAAASPTGGSEDGSVAANPEDSYESAYLSPVTIGGQKFNLDFDTGSADLWVYGVDSVSGNRTAFNPKKSSSWKRTSGASWSITYGDGSGATGFVGTDVVDVGGSTVQRQAVEVAEQVSQSFAEDAEMDGLLGLSFSSINNVQPKPVLTFFDNLKSDLSEPLFTADLEDSTGKGTYDFGTIDHSKHKGDIHYTPVDNSSGFWEISTTKFLAGGEAVDCTDCTSAIVDTGTSLTYLSEDVVKAYYGKVSNAYQVTSSGANSGPQGTVGLWVYPCSEKNNLPNLGIGIGDWTATIKGADMNYAPIDYKDLCAGGLQPIVQGMPAAILGDIFLKQFFVVFDGGENRVGVADKN